MLAPLSRLSFLTLRCLLAGGLCLAMPLALQCQVSASRQVSGIVTDPTGAAIVGAEVVLTSGSFSATQLTDDHGGFAFSLDSAEPGTLKISAPGFQVRTLDGRTGYLQITLLPATAAEQVTVAANRTGVRVIENATSVTILSAQDLGATAAFRTDDILRQVPGFSLFRRTTSRTANPTAQGVSLRGLGPSGASRSLVLLDGIPLNDPFGGWIAWGRVPRASIERLEVLQGGSSLYGPSALAGVVQVLTRPPAAAGTLLEGSAGNLGTHDATLWTGGASGPWQGSVGAEAFATDGYIPVAEEVRGPVDTEAASSQRAIEAEGKRVLGADASIFARLSWFDESRENGTDFQENSTSWRRLALGWDGALAGEASVRAYTSKEDYEQTFSAVSADRTEETPTREQRVPSDAYGLTGQWRHTAVSGNVVQGGVEAGRVSGVSHEAPAGGAGIETAAGGTQTSLAAYGRAQVRLGSALGLTGGLRFDRWTNDPSSPTDGPASPALSDGAWSPLISLRADAGAGFAIMASAYETFRAPTLNELYRSFRVGDVLTRANDALRAERLRGAEAGAQYAAASGTLLGKVTVFRMEVRDPVVSVTLDPAASPILRERRNLGATLSEGGEISLDAAPSRSWSASLGALFTRAVVLDAPGNESLEGNRVPLVPERQATLQVRYLGRSLGASLQARWSGPVYDDDLNTLPLASAFTLDGWGSVRLSRTLDLLISSARVLPSMEPIERE